MSTSPFSSVTAIAVGSFLVLCLESIRRWMKASPYRHVPGPEPSSVIGYLLDLHSPDSLQWHYDMPETYGHVARLKGGVMGADALYITDPLALHSILVREQTWFPESTEFAGLFGIIHQGDGVASVYGKEHRKQRKLIDPVFAAGRISKLTPLFYAVANELSSKLRSEGSGKSVNILDYLGRTALELIARGGLGHTFNSFNKGSKEYTKFHGAITSVLPLASRLFLFMPYLDSWRKIRPIWLRRILAKAIPYIPWSSARNFKAAVDAMHPVYKSLYTIRKKALEEGGTEESVSTASGGKDLVTFLIKSNLEAEEQDRMPDDVVLANIGSIVHGGQETASIALARFIWQVAMDPDLQQHLRAEIKTAKERKGGEDLDYNELNDLPLLDAVCRESLRLFSPVTFVWRRTLKDIVVPLQYPIHSAVSGEETRDLLITKDTQVYLGLSAANRSAAIWGPDAAEFRPERWMKGSDGGNNEIPAKLPGIYSNIMTFLGGGRACPGMKFAILEIKVVLSVLLLQFSFEKTSETIDWRMGITLTPFVRGKEAEGAKVPVKVVLLENV